MAVHTPTQPPAYVEGLHLLVQARDCAEPSLTDLHGILALLNDKIAALGLVQTGIVTHHFDNGSYTLVIGLTESHLSVHTWPEHGIANYDVYLSNYLQVNDGKVYKIHDALRSFFDAGKITITEVKR